MAVDGAPEVVYREDARSYRSLGWSPVFIPVAFGVDWLLSGRHSALVHLPGWIVFGAVLVAIQWLLLHAVRTTHSLYVTADELVVGDEAVTRADVVGVATGRRADPDLPTLGWPNGFPRRSAAVTVRLADGRDVLVPTRFPDQVVEALEVGPPGPEQAAVVRVAHEADLVEIPSIDERAGAVFRVAGYEVPAAPFDAADLRAARLVLVVGDPAFGFAWVDDLDGDAFLRRIAVLPGAMRRGHGTRLLDAALAWAAAQGYATMTATTFADVPWNAPFYAARGFTVDRAPGPGLQAVRGAERAAGLDDVGRRVVMRCPTTRV